MDDQPGTSSAPFFGNGRPQRTHINPKFFGVHLNPSFVKKGNDPGELAVKSADTVSTSKVHVNPNFVGRPLPAVPDQAGATSSSNAVAASSSSSGRNSHGPDPLSIAEYHWTIKDKVSKKVFLNPSFGFGGTIGGVPVKETDLRRRGRHTEGQDSSPFTGSEKENSTPPLKCPPVGSASSSSVFRKIGSHKLIRKRETSEEFREQLDRAVVTKTPATSAAYTPSSLFHRAGFRMGHKTAAAAAAYSLSSRSSKSPAAAFPSSTTPKRSRFKKVNVASASPTGKGSFSSIKKSGRVSLFSTPLQLSSKLRELKRRRLLLFELHRSQTLRRKSSPFKTHHHHHHLNPFRIDRRPHPAHKPTPLVVSNPAFNNHQSSKKDLVPERASRSPGSFKWSSSSSVASAPAKRKLVDTQSTSTVSVAAMPASPTKRLKMAPPSKPVRKSVPKLVGGGGGGKNATDKAVATTLISVQGVRYAVSAGGHKLVRLGSSGAHLESAKLQAVEINRNASQGLHRRTQEFPASGSARPKVGGSPTITTTKKAVKKKLYLEGEEYVEEEDDPGVLVRSRGSMTRASITSYKARSINTIIRSQTRSKQYCMFYNKFGRCQKRDKGVCPYLHDPDKVAVCRRFLNGGNCTGCLLSHRAAPDKMPVCKFFLDGCCTRENCNYRHVKVAENAEVCPDYLKGFCPAGTDCKKKHQDPDRKGGSILPRTADGERETAPGNAKKVPPLKPRRRHQDKAVDEEGHPLEAVECQLQGQEQQVQPVAAGHQRYFSFIADGPDVAQGLPEGAPPRDAVEAGLLADKRQRLLRKVELAKQGWVQSMMMQPAPATGETEGGTPVVQSATRMEAAGSSSPTTLDSGFRSPNDSGPYEEIDEDPADVGEAGIASSTSGRVWHRRPPVGELPSFISLFKPSEGENLTNLDGRPAKEQPEETNYEERLI